MEDAAEEDFSEDGEELGDVDEATLNAISRHMMSMGHDDTRRLSRDLEEGFMDDSDDDRSRRP